MNTHLAENPEIKSPPMAPQRTWQGLAIGLAGVLLALVGWAGWGLTRAGAGGQESIPGLTVFPAQPGSDLARALRRSALAESAAVAGFPYRAYLDSANLRDVATVLTYCFESRIRTQRFLRSCRRHPKNTKINQVKTPGLTHRIRQSVAPKGLPFGRSPV